MMKYINKQLDSEIYKYIWIGWDLFSSIYFLIEASILSTAVVWIARLNILAFYILKLLQCI